MEGLAMIYLLFVALMIFDVIVVFLLMIRSLKGIAESKMPVAKLGWLIFGLIDVTYVVLVYRRIFDDWYGPASNLIILIYPPVIVLVYWILKRFKSLNQS